MRRLATLLATLPVAALLATACARPAATPAAAADVTSAAAARKIAAATATDDDDERYSVYDLDATWRDQHGRARTLASLRGRPRLVAMIYTHCATTCPLTVADLKRVERETADVDFVLVSLDPERDAPARLAAFAREHALGDDRWTLLAGRDDDEVRELAAALGVRYRRLSPAELAHSNTLTLLDADGAVAWQRAGLGDDDATVAAVHALAR